MDKTFLINFSEEQGNYLQRLGNEVETKAFVIDYIFNNHINDNNTAILESDLFKSYMKDLEQAKLSFELAKREFQKGFLDAKVKEITKLDNPRYNWQIDDYLSLECKVTLI